MKFDASFSVPFVLDKLQDGEQLNSSLRKDILTLEKDESQRNEIPTQPITKELFESKWDLLDREQHSFKTLRDELFQRLSYLVTKLNNYNSAVAKSLEINQHTWFHVTRKGGYFSSHNHPMASWSSVYCVDDGGDLEIRDSGITRFSHPIPTANYYMDAGNATLINPFTCAAKSIKLRAGEIVFFPSYLQHEVTPYLGEGTRITIASNYWLESKLVGIRV